MNNFTPHVNNSEIALLRINHLALDVSIGVYDYEKFRRFVYVSITAEIPAYLAKPNNDSISEVVNYEDLVNAAKRAVSLPHTSLLETLCQKIADECFTINAVLAVRVCIEKAQAIEGVESVAVEIYRQR